MRIPKKFKLGRKVYKVEQPVKLLEPGAFGRAWVTEQVIHVAMEHPRSKRQRSDKERFQTFWHETTHAILHDMGSRKYKDEVFVDELAKRIVSVLHTGVF